MGFSRCRYFLIYVGFFISVLTSTNAMAEPYYWANSMQGLGTKYGSAEPACASTASATGKKFCGVKVVGGTASCYLGNAPVYLDPCDSRYIFGPGIWRFGDGCDAHQAYNQDTG